MSKRQNDSDPELEKLDRKITELDRRKKQLEARYRQKERRNANDDRRQRAHRLIGIGAEVESVFERQIGKEELSGFREYLKKVKDVMGAF